MADFTDGVKDYVIATAVIKNFFPIDLKGNADISCYQCRFFSRNSGICQITKEITPFPQRFIGMNCPFRNNEEDRE